MMTQKKTFIMRYVRPLLYRLFGLDDLLYIAFEIFDTGFYFALFQIHVLPLDLKHPFLPDFCPFLHLLPEPLGQAPAARALSPFSFGVIRLSGFLYSLVVLCLFAPFAPFARFFSHGVSDDETIGRL